MTRKNNIIFAMIFSLMFIQTSVSAKTIKNPCKTIDTIENGIYQNFEIVKVKRKVGVKNSFGKYIIEPQFNKIENINDELIKVKLGRNYGLMDYSGRTLIEPKYKDIQVAEFYLKSETPKYLYITKTKRTWTAETLTQKFVLTKNEQTVSALQTDLKTIPHKMHINGKKYYMQLGTLKMGNILDGTPVKIIVPTKVPKAYLNKISTIGLINIFLTEN